MISFNAKVTLNRFPDAADKLPKLAEAFVDKAAGDVAANASENTYAADRVDTSAMANGYQVHEIGRNKRRIDNTQDYHIYQELGFHDRGGGWVPGAPMLLLAAEQVWPAFLDAFKRLELL